MSAELRQTLEAERTECIREMVEQQADYAVVVFSEGNARDDIEAAVAEVSMPAGFAFDQVASGRHVFRRREGLAVRIVRIHA